MKRIFPRLGVLLAPLAIVSCAAPALAQDGGYATLRVCNKGTVNANAVTAYEDDEGLLGYWLDVQGWSVIAPGHCKVVVERQGVGGCEGQSTLPVYVGFAFFDSTHEGTAARVDEVPDLGTWHNNWVQALVTGVGAGPVLSRADKTLCVRRAALSYRLTDRSASCADLPAEGGAPYFPFAAAFRFEPVPSCFYPSEVMSQTAGGDYYLDVAPRPNDLALHASAGSADSRSADTAGEGSASSDPLKQLAIAMAEAKARADTEKKAEEAARAEANRKAIEARSTDPVWVRYESEQQAKWGAPVTAVRDYSPEWQGRQMHVGGTVADVSVEYGGSPSWLTMRFRDSQFVVCSPSPSIFTGLFGDDLSALVDKQIEVIGKVESGWCHPSAGSIRVLDSDSVRLLGAP